MSTSDRNFENKSFREQSWVDVYSSLKNRTNDLTTEELNQLAIAAYLTGKDEESFDLLARAHHQFIENRQVKEAIRCAFWIGLLLMFKGERARGSGWLSRAHRLVEEHDHQGPESGLLLLPSGLGALGAGNTDMAYNNFTNAFKIGNEHNDPDLIALSLLGQGQSLIQMENITEGIPLLDEAMISIESTGISPLVIGIIYCAVIETCHKIFDVRRAQEWTALLSQWCESQPDLIPFRGQCLIRRSQIMHFHGEWPEALDEMNRACHILAGPPGEPAAGEAYYQLAEIYRLRGNLDKAEKSYYEANKWGKNPQPGLSLLRLEQNENRSALKSIQNTLEEAKIPLQRVKILPAYIEIALANDQIEIARTALDELVAFTKNYNAIFLQAVTAYCQGNVLLMEDDHESAINTFRQSLKYWNMLNAPFELASVRYHLGIAYRKKGDYESSKIELTAAQWIFKELEAEQDLRKVEALLQEKEENELFGLTLRELQVLKLVSEGDTNKAIASKLFISERTVERHLSNIFNKLQVNSRTEATSFALKNQIL